MRIMHLIPSLGGGGAERQAALLAAHHARAGHEVHIAALRSGPHAEVAREAGVSIYAVRGAGNHDPLILGRLVGLIRSVRPDIVHTWLTQMDIIGGLAARITRTPWVMSERCCAEAYPATLKNGLRRWVAARSAAIVSNSAGGDAYWQSALGNRVPRAVIPNGLDLDAIERSTPAVGIPVGTNTNVPFILFAGRFTAQKNANCVLTALEQMAGRVEFTALLCGDGPDRDQLAQRVEASSLRDRVCLMGYREDLWSLLKRATVALAPALFEGHPNTVLEAMACGCPLVVSDIPAHRAFLDESMAWLVDPYDPDAIAAAATEAIEDPVEARRRARRAAECAQRFTATFSASEYEVVYGAVLAAANGRADRVEPLPRGVAVSPKHPA